jgi:hypothetical protein
MGLRALGGERSEAGVMSRLEVTSEQLFVSTFDTAASCSGFAPMMLHCYSLVTINEYDEVSLETAMVNWL